jgi:hypothetical protein
MGKIRKVMVNTKSPCRIRARARDAKNGFGAGLRMAFIFHRPRRRIRVVCLYTHAGDAHFGKQGHGKLACGQQAQDD